MSMRQPERRTTVSRRIFLRGASIGMPAAALTATSIAIGPKAAWAQGGEALSPHVLATLVRMSRDTYPHDHFPDALYVAAVTPWDAKAGKDAATRALIEQGVARLDSDATDRFKTNYLGVAWEIDRVTILKGIEQTPFFNTIRADLVVSLYNQPEVWKKLGYEGSSAEHGGYLHRGFNDIDWLPQA